MDSLYFLIILRIVAFISAAKSDPEESPEVWDAGDAACADCEVFGVDVRGGDIDSDNVVSEFAVGWESLYNWLN